MSFVLKLWFGVGMNISKLDFLSEHFILRIWSLLKITNIELKKNRQSFPVCHKNIISIQWRIIARHVLVHTVKKNSESFFAEHEYQSASAGTSRRFGDVGRGRRFRSNWGRTVNRSGRCNGTDGARRGAGGTAVGNRRPPVLRGVVTRGRRSIEAASPQFRAEMLNMWKVRELVDKA